MEVYHLGNTNYADQLTGVGAKLFGGRWNLEGTACIYTSETMALSVLEYAANVRINFMPPSLSITTYTIPDASWKEFELTQLPQNWNAVPSAYESKEWGTKLLHEANFLSLKLPSVIIPSEFNFILNPLHADFKKVKIKSVQPFTFDGRIKK